MIQINLLPGSAGKSGRGGGASFTSAFSGLSDQFEDKFLIGAVSTSVVALLAIAGMFLYQSHQSNTLNQRETDAARDSARFSTVLLARRKAESTRDSVYQQLAIIKSIDDSRYIWPHLLEEINLALPPYTWLTSIEQTSQVMTAASPNADTSAAGKAKADSLKKKGAGDTAGVAKRNRMRADSLINGDASAITFRIIGQTVDIQALTRFMTTLEASPFIRNVQLTRSNAIVVNSQPVTEFQLEAQSQVPAPSVLRTVPLSIAVH